MNWDTYRKEDGFISLTRAFEAFYDYEEGEALHKIRRYLFEIELLQPIRSRQLAACALATANAMFGEVAE